MALFKFTDSILKGNPIQVFNNGNHSRDFTYIDDIIEGIEECYLDLQLPMLTGKMKCLIQDPVPHHGEFITLVIIILNLMDCIKALEDAIGLEAKRNFSSSAW